MAKNKKPRKQYRPRPALNPVGLVLNSMTLVTACERDTMSNESRLAFQALLEGRGTLHDWKTVTHTLNMAGVLSELFYQGAYMDEITASQAAHARCGARAYLGQNLGYSGPDMEAVKVVMEVHFAQFERLTFGEFNAAVALLKERTLHRRFTLSVKQAVAEIKKS